MMIIPKIAFRNIFRQKRRSFFTALSMIIGFILLGISFAFGEGGYGHIIEMFTHSHTGHIQIHSQGYLERPNLYKNFEYTQQLQTLLNSIPEVQAQTKTGDTAQEMFRIGGIFEFKVRQMDRSMAFIDLQRSQQLLGIKNNVHEIAFTFKNQELSTHPEHPVWRLLDDPNLEVLSWLALMPELKAMLKWLNVSMLIMSFILFGIVAAGIVNTLFMSLYERMFEFGVLQAVGTRPGNLALLIVLEAGSLAVISAVFGSVMGGTLVQIFSKLGLDYSDTEFVNVAIIDRIYPVMEPYQFIVYPWS